MLQTEVQYANSDALRFSIPSMTSVAREKRAIFFDARFRDNLHTSKWQGELREAAAFPVDARVKHSFFAPDQNGHERIYWQLEVSSGVESLVRGQVKQLPASTIKDGKIIRQREVIKGGNGFLFEEVSESGRVLLVSAEVNKIDFSQPVSISLFFEDKRNKNSRSTYDLKLSLPVRNVLPREYNLSHPEVARNSFLQTITSQYLDGMTTDPVRNHRLVQHTWQGIPQSSWADLRKYLEKQIKVSGPAALVALYRGCPDVSAWNSAKRLLSFKGVGKDMAESILKDFESAAVHGKDLPASRRYRYLEYLAEEKYPNLEEEGIPGVLTDEEMEVFINMDKGLRQLKEKQGLKKAIYCLQLKCIIAAEFQPFQGVRDEELLTFTSLLSAIDRNLYQEISAYLHPGAVARLIGVSEADLLLSPRYTKIYDLAEGFFPPVGNPYTLARKSLIEKR